MSNSSKVAFIFPGQGAQYIGMGKDLYENYPKCREVFQEASYASGFDMAKLCFEGPEEKLNSTEFTQPAILTVSIAALKLLEEEGIKPDIVAGLSLGEYSALVTAGAIKFKDAVALVKKRGRFMQDAVPNGIGGMAAVLKLDEKQIYEVCEIAKEKGIVEPANFNCPGQIVIAGEMEALSYACEIAKEKGALRTVMLPVSGPFHSSMLKGAADKLYEELQNLEISKPNVPVITNVTGEYMNEDSIRETLRLQVMTSVKWEHSIRKMIEEGVESFIEIGPGKTLSSFVKKIDRKLETINYGA